MQNAVQNYCIFLTRQNIFCNFAPKKLKIMKKALKKLGIWPVYGGVLLLLAGYGLGWTDHNWFLPIPPLLIAIGIAGYVCRGER